MKETLATPSSRAFHLAKKAIETGKPVAELTSNGKLAAASSEYLLFLAGKTGDLAKAAVDTAENPDVEFQLEGKIEASKLLEGGRKFTKKMALKLEGKAWDGTASHNGQWRIPRLKDLEIMKRNGSLFKEEEWILGEDSRPVVVWPVGVTGTETLWFYFQPSTGIYRGGTSPRASVRLVRDM